MRIILLASLLIICGACSRGEAKFTEPSKTSQSPRHNTRQILAGELKYLGEENQKFKRQNKFFAPTIEELLAFVEREMGKPLELAPGDSVTAYAVGGDGQSFSMGMTMTPLILIEEIGSTPESLPKPGKFGPCTISSQATVLDEPVCPKDN